MKREYIVSDKALAKLIQQDLERFAREWRTDTTIGSHEPVDAFCDVMLRGGKRIRGMLAMQSYYAHGGKDASVALGAARVFEIIQTSLLVVDDIADRSSLRRGGPSAHIRIAARARADNMKGSPEHYGTSQAMNVAYAGLHKATVELLKLNINDETARQACIQFHENICITVNGQVDDIFNEMTRSDISEADIESVLVRKSAYYTILSPIELGASLAGVRTLPEDLRDYAIHTGCAFQIADDIISTFGVEGITGKSSNDDIREGKLTLLAHFALAHGTPEQVKQLHDILGNEAATDEQCNTVRSVMKTMGALDYALRRARSHEVQALTALDGNCDINEAFKTYLQELTDYVVNRKA